MKESDLYLPMKEWFTNQGYQVRPEIFMIGRTYDAVAVKENTVIAIEMKLSLNKSLLSQIIFGDMFADYSFAVISTTPRIESETLGICLGRGIGILSYKDNALKEIYPAKQNEKYLNNYHDDVIKLVQSIGDSDAVGGNPNLKGIGPAQMVESLIIEYRKKFGNATWKALYEEIPNHYCSYRSMQGAMSMIQKRRAWKEMHDAKAEAKA